MSITTPDPTLDFKPLFPTETEDVILARLIGWANEGLDPVADADNWVDTREGGHWRTCIIGQVREFARLYDLAGTDVPMSGFVLWSWGTYLDDLGAVWDVLRKAATPATGTVRFANSGAGAQPISAGVTVSAVPSTQDDPAPEFTVTTAGSVPAGGNVTLPITARVAGKAGNVAIGAITAPSTPLPPGITLTNLVPTTSGEDPETDDAYRVRLMQAIAGKGPGAVRDYIRWATQWAGVGRVKVIPVWNGPGTVMVTVSDQNGQPVAAGVYNGLQANLDPVAGTGAGTAPVGANVTVNTPALLNITVDATITFETGYTWDGAGASTAVGAGIMAAITRYLLTIPPGGEVVLAHVSGIISTWPGVHDVTLVKLNTVAANVAVVLSPPQTPVLLAFNPH